ncbi:hypothetical protein OESDEN_12622 [Oesophagostomum dentatum]|uniref:Peptidase C1A papain C-terminal domain-containing protein n=1 Tax=Oesophagostomum dentatum TaxID=61180 RepID=A0A0B1SVS2_OESDE|nr:hypothetical protein OESDEN_12622 [Oesophagostomum dentatum]
MNATAIMYEIMTHGPVAARLFAYEDLYHYKGGIYVHTGGKSYGLQPVRIIGWGEENGVLYWLVANSWNTDWGENGTYIFDRKRKA